MLIQYTTLCKGRLRLVELLLALLLVLPIRAYSFSFKVAQKNYPATESHGIQSRTSNICNRTKLVRDAIVRLIEGVHNCEEVTNDQLAATTGVLNVSNRRLGKLKPGDFDGLTSLTVLDLSSIRLSSLPAGIFNDLTSLEALYLWGNFIETLPEDIFHSLPSLKWLYLDQNELATLPAEIFHELTSLTVLDLRGNVLSDLPSEIFDRLINLESLDLSHNRLAVLPVRIFENLTALKTLYLWGNSLESFPNGIFDGLTSLERLGLWENSLSTLPTGTFDGLTSLERLELNQNDISILSDGVFDRLNSLEVLHLGNNRLQSLPKGIFADLSSLKVLGLWENSIHTLPLKIFDELISLQVLGLHQNSLHTLPENIFVKQTKMPLSTFYPEGDYYDFPGLSLGGNPGAPFSPTAQAGLDQAVNSATTISLFGKSSGPWGDLVRWQWEQVSAPGSDMPALGSKLVDLAGKDTATPSFTVPMIGGEYHFKLVTIPANEGIATALWGHVESLPDWVTVHVNSPTDVTDLPEKVAFALQGNYPNPFNSFTNIIIDLPQTTAVSVDLFNTLGQHVHQVKFPLVATGASKLLPLNITGLPSGTYIYRITARVKEKLHVARGRMTLIR